jgi:hypothetical protein
MSPEPRVGSGAVNYQSRLERERVHGEALVFAIAPTKVMVFTKGTFRWVPSGSSARDLLEPLEVFTVAWFLLRYTGVRDLR